MSLGLFKRKERLGYALDSLWGQTFATGESGPSKLHSVVYIELYQYPWLPVHQVTSSTVDPISIISINLSLPRS